MKKEKKENNQLNKQLINVGVKNMKIIKHKCTNQINSNPRDLNRK